MLVEPGTGRAEHRWQIHSLGPAQLCPAEVREDARGSWSLRRRCFGFFKGVKVQVIHFPRGSGAMPFTGASIAEATQPRSLAVLTAGSRHRFRAQQDRLTCCEPAFGWGVSLAHPSGRPSPRRLQWE